VQFCKANIFWKSKFMLVTRRKGKRIKTTRCIYNPSQ
jgi:hypothetical protein